MRIGSKSRTWLGRSRLGRFVFWLRFLRLREQIARRHLHGNGIEIGALHLPLRTPHGTSVTYVDNWTAAELQEQFPELAEQMTVSPNVIDDGTRLDKFADRSQDFVIANHFLEHTEDPIGVLKTLLRVTKSSGSIYLAVPTSGVRSIALDRQHRSPTSFGITSKDRRSHAASTTRSGFD